MRRIPDRDMQPIRDADDRKTSEPDLGCHRDRTSMIDLGEGADQSLIRCFVYLSSRVDTADQSH